MLVPQTPSYVLFLPYNAFVHMNSVRERKNRSSMLVIYTHENASPRALSTMLRTRP